MTSVYRVYFTPYSITRAQAGNIDSFKVKNISSSWFSAAGISLKGTTKVTFAEVNRLQSIIYKDLFTKAGQLRFLERSLNQAYGRDRTRLQQAVVNGTVSHNRIGLTFNGSTYKNLYNDFLTMTDAVALSAAILRTWTKTTLH